ncbi:MAG TPA: hypothetical protein DDY31_17710 [Lachnospiraceae bacterium]|nr:hypothetical protein [Lachnospiraceae bacterium]
MSELVGVIQQIVQNTIQAMKLSDKATGTVESVAPLRIKVDDSMQSIPESALILTDTVKERIVPVQNGEGTVIIREGLKPGDKVLMMRVQRGYQYIILSKIT